MVKALHFASRAW